MSAAEPVRSPGASAVLARALVKRFHDPERGLVEAVRGVDLDCRYGEIYGLLGPNGAGKTTTLRMLATILAPSAGSAQLDGADVATEPLEVRRRLGYLSGSTGLYPRLSGRELLAYCGKLHGMAPDVLAAAIERVVDAFDLGEFVDRRCEGLSTGQRQRVSIARAVLHDPAVLILDEPTTGLDILATSDMIEFIEARRTSGTCVLFSTHVLSEAERLCDRIGVIDHGRLLGEGTLDELRTLTGETFLDAVFRKLVSSAAPAEPSSGDAARTAQA